MPIRASAAKTKKINSNSQLMERERKGQTSIEISSGGESERVVSMHMYTT